MSASASSRPRAPREGPRSLERLRRTVQIVSAAASNAYLPGFLSGTIYRGSLKGTCVPFLNCYSCPGAVGACPVGSLQSIAAGQKLPLYVLGGTVAAGSLAGRFACGWLCPFGLIQELLFRLSRIRAAIPAALLKLRYAVLALLLPLAAFWTGPSGVGAPYFCKYICPAGTLEAGLPLLALNSDLRPLVGPVFLWKVAVLAVVIGACLVAYRPFCRTLCPLGALYGLLNPVSIWRIEVDAARCDRCGTCAKVCPVGLNPAEQPNSRECLRCLRCTRACPAGALTFAAGDRKVPAGERGRTHDGLADSAT